MKLSTLLPDADTGGMRVGGRIPLSLLWGGGATHPPEQNKKLNFSPFSERRQYKIRKNPLNTLESGLILKR